MLLNDVGLLTNVLAKARAVAEYDRYLQIQSVILKRTPRVP